MYSDELKVEIQSLIDNMGLNCSIEEFHYYVEWGEVCEYEKLSELFMEKFQDKLYWSIICSCQPLTESFIEKFKHKVNQSHISEYQKLSETFIEKHKDRLIWSKIGLYQKLSEPFMEKYMHTLEPCIISKYQKLSEPFIEKHAAYLNWYLIKKYQKLSKSFIKKYKQRLDGVDSIFTIKICNLNTLYWNIEQKRELIPKCYETEGDYIIAYKGIRKDRYSNYNFQYQYLPGETYECHCDCNLDEENSFGLSVWTEKGARSHCSKLIIKVKVHINDIGAVVHGGGKIRCSKFTVLT